MPYNISVKFGEGRHYEFVLHEHDVAGATPASARRWLDQQFLDLGCEPINPTGKTLVVDKILVVAKAMGDQPFARNEAVAREFARNALLAMERKAILIDLATLSVG